MSKGYQGHKNWNHWNVSLWISNDERLYRLALRMIREAGTKDRAVELFLSELRSGGIEKTPDGATYSKSAVRAAFVGLE